VNQVEALLIYATSTKKQKPRNVEAGGQGSGCQGSNCGRHPEAGTFQKTGTAGKSDYYKGEKGTIVRVDSPSNPNGKTKVAEYNGNSPKREQQVFQTYRNGGASQENDFQDFMKNRYGINS
jgi:hypothetical protein